VYDKYLLVDGSARTVFAGEAVVGFQVDARIAYYRGLGLSMVEDVSLTVDGTVYSREDTTFTVHGNTYRLDDMESVVDDRWGFTEKATIRVRTKSPIPPGDHIVTLTERLRISYIPLPTVTSDTKTLTVAN
jgi:Domain of unknown function (DUF6379)